MPKGLDNRVVSPEQYEQKLIQLARDQALQELTEGRASQQVLLFYLKQGTIRDELELEEIRARNLLTERKIASEGTGNEVLDRISQVLEALTSYRV
jgi:hypothetical protein